MNSRSHIRALCGISLSCITVFVFCLGAYPFLFSTAMFGSSPTDVGDSAELIQIVTKQSASWNRGDLEAFMEPYWHDERLTFSSSGRTKRGWQATFENYQKNYPDRETMGTLTFTEMETQELGPDAMLMLGNWHLERAVPVGGNFSLVWKRLDGKWLIVHDHSSALKP